MSKGGVVEPPAASQLLSSTHETPDSRLFVDASRLGLVMIDHEEPFQCSINVLLPAALNHCPTALQLVAVAHDTPSSSAAVAPAGMAGGDSVQVEPSHRSASAFGALFVNE